MKILLIAPFPPPTTGHSLASQVLLDALRPLHDVDAVDLSKSGFTHGANSLERVRQVAAILLAIRRKQRGARVIYLTIAESFAGNLKDLVIYLICFRRLRYMVIHLHGGTLRRGLLDRRPWLRRVNAFFLRRIGRVVILGESHRGIFAGLVPDERIRIVSNSAEDQVFVDDQAIARKFAEAGPLRLLFLSNLIEGKGHFALLEAYLSLRQELRSQVRLDFAGDFESPAERERFEAMAHGHPLLTIHGVVAGTAKRSLLANAHALCLPTSLFEGQPISILEAYASGCVVLTTLRGGIPDVFTDGQNGIALESANPAAIRGAIERLLERRSDLGVMARLNAREARSRYTSARYRAAMISVLEEGSQVAVR